MCRISWQGQAASRPSLWVAGEGSSPARLRVWGLGNIKGDYFWRKSWLCLSQVTLRNLWLHHCCFTLLCLTEPSAELGTTCLGEASLQGSQGDEDGFLEEKCSNGMGPGRLAGAPAPILSSVPGCPGPSPLGSSAFSRALRRLRAGLVSSCQSATSWLHALPWKGLTSLFLSPPLCKMGMIVTIPAS